MSNSETQIQEAAVSTPTLTPEQLAEAAKFFASQQQEVAEVAAEEAGQIDHEKKAELIATFNEMIENPKYWGNEKRIKRLEDALKLPKFDDPSMRQFYISAQDELIKAAMEIAIKNQSVPVEPTEAEIEELAMQKSAAKEEKEAQKAAKKAAKKNS